MASLAHGDILDDLRAAEEGLHRFERRYWVSSDDFFALYSKGHLDDGENAEDVAEWAGHCKLHQKRLAALEQISRERIASLPRERPGELVRLTPGEPALELA